MTIADKFREQGKQEGKLEGQIEGKQEVALMLLREGAEIAFITKVTGFSVAHIESLRSSCAWRIMTNG